MPAGRRRARTRRGRRGPSGVAPARERGAMDGDDGANEMKNGFKIIDADSHAMEPEDMWERYLDKKFAAYMPTHKRLAPDFPWFGELNLLGHRFGFTGQGKGLAGPKFVETEDGEDITFFDAAYDYIERGFSAASYLDYMDTAGIDHMF